MERGKGSSNRVKAKTQHFPSDLFVLGSKSTTADAAKRPIPSGSGDRKREGASLPIVGGKKSKPFVTGPTPLGRPNTQSPTGGLELWETQATEVEPSEFVDTVLESYNSCLYDKASNIICGGLKVLKNTRWKPDSVITVGLIYLARVKPFLFSSENVTNALSVLLRCSKDPQSNFKNKTNPTVAVLAANLLARGYHETSNWPTAFIKLYIDDAVGDRVWVDQVECKGFVNNLMTGFGTKRLPQHINFLIPDVGPMSGISRADSPLTINLADDDDGGTDLQVMPRYAKFPEVVEQIVLDLLNNRRQPTDSINKNYLKLLASTAGLIDVRVFAATRLEMWFQSTMLSKSAQELLLSICVNCDTHSLKDVQVIGSIVKIRLKTKALIHFYLSCIRELINAHDMNLSSFLKHTIFNELSNTRNPNNMAMIGVVFQSQPDEAATLLAEVFLELLMRTEDYLRPLRLLLREIVRALRHDINLLAFCRGLIVDKRDDQFFREFEFKERMFCAIVDLLAHACYVGVSPAVKESFNLAARGDKRDIQTLITFHSMVATIEQEAILWLKDLALKIYHPVTMDFVHSLHKLVFMEQQDAYYKVDNWPPESERSLIFRLAAESPVYETTLFTILMIGLSKEHPINGPDSLELADQLVKRAALLTSDYVPMLSVTRKDLFDVVLKVTAYHHPDNISLPHGYMPPKLAISNCYWKSWIMLLVISAHNPATIGDCAWQKYPTLRMLMEMCITNHFSYPPPTMQKLESGEDIKLQEARLTQIERDDILEFEKHLAAASTKATITEATSLLLPQLITLDPLGAARKPPQVVLEQLSALNASHRLGHLLCRSRQPDFLLQLIQQQGASQSMPWLADLVENSDSSLSHLPIQCLCEFLLTSGPPEKQSKGQQLVEHLQHVLTSPDENSDTACEVMEYLLRRLKSSHMSSRLQAIKALKLVLVSTGDRTNVPAYLYDSLWLQKKLPSLPHFAKMLPNIVLSLRQAAQVENDPSYIASYIQFLAVHASDDEEDDDMQSMAALIHDMAQLIVERSVMMNAIMPNGTNDPMRANTLHSLMLIFYSYLEKLRQPSKETYDWFENNEHVLVTWSSGQQATLHILVIQAMIVLLSNGEGNDPELYDHLLDIWFPPNSDPPKAYLVDTSEDALITPDWILLKMIRSGVPRLVNAALFDLSPAQLVLFIQSFGIPVNSMSLLLQKLDTLEPSEIMSATFDRACMTKLVSVQRRRGVTGGDKYLQYFGEPESIPNPPAYTNRILMRKLFIKPTTTTQSSSGNFHLSRISVLFTDVLSNALPDECCRAAAFALLQKTLLVDAKGEGEKFKGISLILQHLMGMVQSQSKKPELTHLLDNDPETSCLLIRLLWNQLQTLPQSFQAEFVSCLQQIANGSRTEHPGLKALLLEINSSKAVSKADQPDVKPVVLNPFTAMFTGSKESMGHVLDQLVASKPELMCPSTESEMRMLLFGKPAKSETGENVVEQCRPYLLTLLIHRASWDILHTLVNHLLSQFAEFYSATAVLDFLDAMIHNPKLWQGREKHVPKHQSPEPVLDLTESQVLCLVEYIVEESVNKGAEPMKNEQPSGEEAPPIFLDALENRLSLLMQSFNKEYFPKIIKDIASRSDDVTSTRSNVSKHLLVLMYLHIPGLIQFLIGTEQESLLKEANIAGWSCSTLDKISHTLLTALTSSFPDPKDGFKRSHEYEIAARKMAVVHPALVLRQLPMLAASLQGRVHLDYHVLKTRNHINVFSQVLGLLDLLKPYVFSASHRSSLHMLLDAYLTLYKMHGNMKDVIHMFAKFVAFLQQYIVHEAAAATKYLQTNSQTLAAVQKRHPSLTPLRSLLSGVLTLREDGEETEGPQQSVVVTATADLVTTPPPFILAALNKNNGEEIYPALMDLEHLSFRNAAILEVVSEQISDLLMSPYSNIRSLAHLLLARLFKYNPQCNALTGYLRCLESGQGEIVLSALEKLPEIVVSAQENAVLLLQKAFSLGVRSNLGTLTYISKAIAMLNQQTGC